MNAPMAQRPSLLSRSAGRRPVAVLGLSGSSRSCVGPHATQTAMVSIMLRYLAATLLGLACFGTSSASALDCFPHCDYYSDYGPYRIGPSLYCNPRCGLEGNCSPFLQCRQQSRGIPRSKPATAEPCLPDNGRCTSNYQCCSGSCNW